MKRCLFLFLCIVVLQKSFAQITFCPPGAKWNYRFEQYWMDQRIDHNEQITYISDSIVGGDTIRVLHHMSFFWTDTYSPLNNKTSLKQHGDTIFMRNSWTSNQWQILYNFAALPGQSWTNTFLTAFPNIYTVTVDSVDTFLLGNKWVKRLKVTYTNNGFAQYHGYIAEHMGSSGHLFNYATTTTHDAPTFKELLCYTDNSLGQIQFTSKACNYTNVGLNELSEKLDLKIYPNPVNDVINIESGLSEAEVLISDLNGRIVKQETLNNQKINTSDLIPGMYFLQVVSDKEIVYKTKVVKQ
ncbi:MAG: T9SS type A sorting domain-containing protein [Bacteroidia bacterium]|nr:T9SS type A sorting domain-containing protein [Bacteroidia bacterium]